MIASQKIGKSFMGALDYNLKKLSHPDPGQRAELLDMSFVALDRESIRGQVEVVRQLRPALKRYVYHTSLNFSREEAGKLGNEKLLAIARDYLEGMGFTHHPYLIFRHYDAGHPHVHLLASRIGFDGSVVSDSNNYRRSEALVRRLEKAHGLAEVARSSYKAIETANDTAIAQGSYTDMQLGSYTEIQQGIYTDMQIDRYTAIAQSSDIPERAPTKSELEMIGRTGKASEKMILQELLKQLLTQRHENLQSFINKGEQAGIYFLFNQSAATGRISGITYLHRNFKATGKALGNRFKWGEIAKHINYEQSRDCKAAGQATSRTTARYGEYSTATASSAASSQPAEAARVSGAIGHIRADRAVHPGEPNHDQRSAAQPAASGGAGEPAGTGEEHTAGAAQETVSVDQLNTGDRDSDTWVWDHAGIQIAHDEDDELKRRKRKRSR